ncbi:hypothetical protein ACOQFB_22680 [Anaeromyxobacter sp. Red801]|uniref:hypothetical protein n=1 Tax=Anaeromyxobacter sp. Red801 TaxID=3411632 RepID=UPI003B9E21E8
MGNFAPVQPGQTALAIGAGTLAVLAVTLLALLLRTRRPGVPAEARALLAQVPGALGDAALLLDPEGFVVAGNAEAAALAGLAPDRLRGAKASVILGEDLAVLQRGAARGPSAARVQLRTRGGAAAARAVVVRVSSRPPRDLAVLRPEPALPRPTPPPLPPARPGAGACSADLGAIAAALREPLARASTAASMLRLLAPRLALGAGELARLEGALGDLERRLGALGASSGGSAARPVDLAAALGELAAQLPPGVRVRATLEPAPVLADEARLRAMLRELLRAMCEALPAGGELTATVAVRRGAAVLELGRAGGRGAGEAGAAALARAALGPEGARVEEETAPGRGRVLRLVLPLAAPPAAPAHAPTAGATGPSFV